MISAQEARQNLINYEANIYTKVENQVKELLDTISKSIAYHSQNGIDSLDFCPYDRSRFSSHKELTIAQEIFSKILTSNGYEISHNDAFNNSLKIRW